MGLSIKDIISKQELEIKDLKGEIIIVDAFNTLYQFLSTIRQPDGTPLMDNKEKITSHLSGIFYRVVNLLSEGLKLVFVFDGKAPDLKAKTHKKRSGVRDTAAEKYESAKAEEDVELMRRYSSQLIRLDDDMIIESKELLEALGVKVVSAPSEGEAQAAYICKKEKSAYAVSSQDYDSLLFGAPRLIQNLTLSRKRKTAFGWKEIKPEMMELDSVLKELDLNIDQLISLGILVGTDYNPKGAPGLGQKKALKIVQQYKKPEEIFEDDVVKEKIASLDEEDQFDWKAIYDLFKNHPVEDVVLSIDDFNIKADEDKIKEILVNRHDFSLERVEKQLEKLRGLQEEKKQKSLGKWF